MHFVGKVLVLLLLSVMPAAAAEPAGAAGLLSNQPIAVNADSFSADLRGESGTYRGNVLVVQGAVHLRADEIAVVAPGGRPTRMEARGNVVVESPSGTATGTIAIYDIAAQLVRLTGNVVLTNNANVMRGETLEVEIATGRASLTSGVTAGLQNGPQGQGSGLEDGAAAGATAGSGRVQGLFIPQNASEN